MSNHTTNPVFTQLSFDDIEIWRDVPGYEGLYMVSSFGRVKSFHAPHGKILKDGIRKICVSRNGYCYVILTKDGKIDNQRIHRLVMLAFKGICPATHTVNHKDGNKCNNQLSNLEYVTQRDNNLHSYRVLKRTAANGEDKPQAKLTEENVREIRSLLDSKSKTNKQIGQRFGVGATVISNIKHGQKWRHLK